MKTIRKEKIVSIKPVGKKVVRDIEVRGDHKYFAGGILVSNSLAIPMTADLFIAIIVNEDLDRSQKMLWKQLKNRFSDISLRRRFGVGVDKSKMKLKNLSEEEQSMFMRFHDDKGNGENESYEHDSFEPPSRSMV